MSDLSAFGLLVVVVACVLIAFLPRRLAIAPLLFVAVCMTFDQGVKLGPFHFYAIRIVIAIGILRAVLRSEWPTGALHGLDKLVLVAGACTVLSSVAHDDVSQAFTFSLGLVFNTVGCYWLIRTFISSAEDVVLACRTLTILLVVLAVEMALEQVTSRNYFSLLAQQEIVLAIREGRVRAQGTFAHPILAGTVGAAALPLVVALWSHHRALSVLGVASCATIVYASSSSGPAMSFILAALALLFYALRQRMRTVRYAALVGYLGLELAMKPPAYYLLARIDLSGGSTGWHRVALINAAIDHFDEWWLAGTDVTRHWLPHAVGWSPSHVDITNHYIYLGVLGGLLLVLLFVFTLSMGFHCVGHALKQSSRLAVQHRFVAWALGASLFAHAIAMISVSYTDQTFMFLYLVLAAAASMRALACSAATTVDEMTLATEGSERPLQGAGVQA